MLYEVVKKVVVSDETIENNRLTEKFSFTTPNLIGYKVIAGLYIFYITEEVYLQGVEQGIIKPIEGEVPEQDYGGMLLVRGLTVNHRMPLTLKLSTIPYLKKELTRANKDPKRVTVKAYAVKWSWDGEELKEAEVTYLHQITVDLEKREIIENTAVPNGSIFNLGFLYVSTYEQFLDRLASHLDREFMNSRNLFEMMEEHDFYQVDYWLQRSEKYEFIFE